MELRLSDRHIVALNLLLVTVLAYFAALALNDLVMIQSAPGDAPITQVHARTAPDATNHPRADYQAIVDRDLFNIELPPPPKPQVVEEDIHLTLIGVSQSTKGKPYAIVADAHGEQAVYKVGETIPDSGKLVEVDKDRAIVEHHGKQVVLEIPKEELGGGDEEGEEGARGESVSPAQASYQDMLRHRRMRRHFQ